MATVKLLTSLASPTRAWGAGETYECSEGEAVRLIAAGFAVPIAAPVTERAVATPAQERRTYRKKG